MKHAYAVKTLSELINLIDRDTDRKWFSVMEIEIPGLAEAEAIAEDDDFAKANEIEAAYIREHANEAYMVSWPDHVTRPIFNSDACYGEVNLPQNLETVEDVRMMGLAGLAYLGETNEEPVVVFRASSGIGNRLEVYSDDSVCLDVNVLEIYPSAGDYLASCSEPHDEMTAKLCEWLEQ